ncbi:MAG: N-acetyltransferase [Spirochaetales bacterium]|nr:N-acetyltransferase [Spirochaetales bacterium]
MIRNADSKDASQMVNIYNHYIENTTITFEEKSVTQKEMEIRISDCIKEYPWLVYEENGKIIGYCYATKWRVRSAYRHSAETTVYVHKDHHGKGTGTLLYKELIKQCKDKGLHILVAGIALPNDKSQKIHEKIGFKKIAHFEEIGRKFDQWLDVGYWEYKL